MVNPHPASDPSCPRCAALMPLPCFSHFLLWQAAGDGITEVECDPRADVRESLARFAMESNRIARDNEDLIEDDRREKMEVADLERMWALPGRDV